MLSKLEALESKYKKAEEALRREKERREQYLNIAGVMLAIVNADEKITMINKKGCEILGYKEKELIGKNWFDLLVPQRIRDEVKDVFHKLMAGDIRPVEYYENPLLTKDGEERLIPFHNAVIRGPNDQIVAVLFSAEDITERKKTEEALVHERSLLHLLMDSVPDWIFFKDAQSRFTTINKAHAQLLGLADPKESLGKTDFDFFPREIAQRFYAEEQKIIQSGKPVVARVRQTPTRERKIMWVSETKIPLHDETGKVVGLIGISRDISKLKRAEEKVTSQRKRLEDIMESMVDGVTVTDMNGRITAINRAVTQQHGYTKEEAVGKTPGEILMAKEDIPKFLEAVKILASGEIVKNQEYMAKHKDGRVFPVSVNLSVLKDAKDKSKAIIAVHRDITQRRKMEEALIQERNLLQALIDNIPDAIYFKDDKNRFIRVNKPRAELSGTTPQSMIGKTDFDFFPQEQAKEAFADDSRVMESNRPLVSKIEKITHVDGTEHRFSVTKIPRHNEKGEVIGTMGISRDITEHWQQEQQFVYMATHDTLTGLANRALFSDHLALTLARAQRNRQRFPVMLLDLDNFKDVNDRLRHSVGDKLLKAAGDRLKSILRKADTVARMGGDEFLLLLPETTKTEDVAVVAQRILAVFRKPFLLDNHEVNTAASIGIAIYPSHGKEADTLIKNADIAMYRVKRYGRNNYQYYTTTAEGKPTE